jgi:hypothetical protein
LKHADFERVPGATGASADARKFTHYLLNHDHLQGRAKAKFFAELGYTVENWQELRDEILTQLPDVEGRYSRSTRIGGELYEAIVTIKGSNIRTFWEVE